MKFKDLFLDRVFGNQTINRHRSLLADSMGAVGRLVFDRGIPPRVEVDHVIRTCQIQSGTTRLQRNQEQLTLTPLKRVDPPLAFLGRRRTIEVLVRDFHLVQCLANHGQVFDELAEDQRAVTFLTQFFDQ